jgi:hypothetical protein
VLDLSRGKERAVPAINKIELRLATGNRPGADTDGDVFLGICGREFFVDSQGDFNDFQRNSNRTYIFGDGANVARPEENDPRSPWQLEFNDIIRLPLWIRFEPGGGGDWNVERVDLAVTAGTVEAGDATSVVVRTLENRAATPTRPAENPHVWLGERRGKFLFIPFVQS